MLNIHSLAKHNSKQIVTLVRYASSKSPLPANDESATTFPDGWDNARRFTEIPGPGKFQLIRAFMPGGDLHNIKPDKLNEVLKEKYGEICRLPGMFGKSDMIMSFNPSYFSTVYRTEGVWPKRVSMTSFEYFRTKIRPDVFKGMGGLASDQGETWHKLRSAVNPVMMPPKVAKSYIPAIDAVTRDFMKKVQTLRNADGELPATFSNELNLWSLEAIGVIALDRRLGVMSFDRDADADLLIKSMKDFSRLSLNIELAPPIWKYYQTKEFKQLMEVYASITRLVMKYVDESLTTLDKKITKDDDPGEDTSILQKLLRVDRTYAILMTFDTLFGGLDTTTAASSVLLYMLAKNPAEQEKLRQEVFQMIPDTDVGLQASDLDNMPYLRACIKESMRVHPLITAHLRSTGQNLIVEGYQIPKDTSFVMASSMLQTDEKYFKDAKKFKPERWLRDAGGQLETTKCANPFAFLPFGFGSRMCVGRRFAETEMQILAARILREYRIEWHHGDMEYAAGLILAPCSDLKFKLVRL